jgi:ketosteroid isomerase-like protein
MGTPDTPLQTNAEIARRLWNATAEGNVDALLEGYSPDVVWHSYGKSPIARVIRGSAALLEYFALTADLVDDMKSDLLEVYGSERGAVIRYRVQASRGPKHLDGEVLLAVVIEDGRVVRGDLVPFEPRAHDAFWSVE